VYKLQNGRKKLSWTASLFSYP